MTEREELIAYLESDQLVAERSLPVVRAQLSRRAVLGLWGLRVFAVITSGMVIYTFIAQLGH
jgi:hypothetical protein